MAPFPHLAELQSHTVLIYTVTSDITVYRRFPGSEEACSVFFESTFLLMDVSETEAGREIVNETNLLVSETGN